MEEYCEEDNGEEEYDEYEDEGDEPNCVAVEVAEGKENARREELAGKELVYWEVEVDVDKTLDEGGT